MSEKVKQKQLDVKSQQQIKIKKQEKNKQTKGSRIMEEKVLREIAKIQKERLREFLKREDILNILARYRRPLKHVYNYYSESVDWNITKLNKFCQNFNVSPQLMAPEDVVGIFKNVIISREKEHKGGKIDSMDFDVRFGYLIIL